MADGPWNDPEHENPWGDLTEKKARDLLTSADDGLTRDTALKMLRGGPWGIWAWNELPHEARSTVVLSSAESPADMKSVVFGYDCRDEGDATPQYQTGLYVTATLVQANLEGAVLSRAHLEGAHLTQADLRGALLRFAHLEGAYLMQANLQGADLMQANLKGADLTWAEFEGANLERANLQAAVLDGLLWSGKTDVALVQADAATLDAVPLFKRHVEDTRFIRQYRRDHPRWAAVWWLTSDYGRSAARWAGWSLGLAVFFGVLYSPAPSFVPSGWLEFAFNESFNSGFSPFYFSIVTFTTLGFGDFTPANLATEIAVVVEVILGYIMLGGLISIFANKLARRS